MGDTIGNGKLHRNAYSVNVFCTIDQQISHEVWSYVIYFYCLALLTWEWGEFQYLITY
jgi:hypothetical protein